MKIATAATLIPIALCAVAPDARAGDGALEINQSCIAQGCFPGDAAGFPVQTQVGGAYVLTSNIVVPDENTTAVSLADAARLDLNQFSISGVTSCTGEPAVCAGAGGGDGVSGGAHVSIRNGSIRKMGSNGVSANGGTQVENVLIEQNGAEGIIAWAGSEGWIVRDCRIHQNGLDGVRIAAGSGGIGSLVRDNTIWANGGYGVRGNGMLVTGNTITRNADLGIFMNALDGVGAFGGNHLWNNNGGNANPQTSGGFQVGPNVCGSDLTCP